MRVLGNMVLWVGLLAFGAAAGWGWATAPQVTTSAVAGRASASPPAPERIAAVEGVFCGMVADGITDARFGATLSQSPELQHQTLGALAGRWGQDGSPGARAQVLLECRRLGLTP